jgi:type IV pilus assembly protein PilV
MRHRKRIGRAAGFSLVEVLVALIVISVGLLGVAKMQALALSNTSSARMRSLASIQAASLASSMHVNRSYWVSVVGGTAALVTVTPNTGGPGAITTAPGDATLQAALTAAEGAAPTTDPSQYCEQGGAGSVAPCTPVELAAADLLSWANDLNLLMPNAQVNITCESNPLTCKIQLNWTENAVSINKQTAGAANQFTSSSYTLYVQP